MAVRARKLQRLLFDGGYAGICFPAEYGGQGLTRAHQEAFTQESIAYQMPTLFNVPTLSHPRLPPARLRHRGAEASAHPGHPPGRRAVGAVPLRAAVAAPTWPAWSPRATRDGDVFVLNGSKIWSSGAFRSDYSLCLARTDSSVPKHQGLTMFILKIHQPGIEVQRIKMVNGTAEFCQEYFDDVADPGRRRVGRHQRRVDGGVAAAVPRAGRRGGGSPYTSGLGMGDASKGGQRSELGDLARATGQTADPVVRQLVAEARVNDRVQSQLIERVTLGIRPGPCRAQPGP